MAIDKERVLNGFRESRKMMKNADGVIKIPEDKIVSFGKNQYDLKAGWVMPNLSDEDLAKILCVDNMVAKLFLAKEITIDELFKIIDEVGL